MTATRPAPSAPVAASADAAPPTPRFSEKRDAILASAARAFTEQGVRGATLSGIAAAVGLATNSVTYYYRKKEDLATACFLQSIAVFDQIARVAAQQASVAARVHDYYARHAQLLADIETGTHPPIVNFNDIRALPDAQAEQVYAAYTDMFRRVRALLTGPETATLQRDDRNARAHIVLSVAHWMRSWIDRYEPADYARAAQRVSDCLLHGLAGARGLWKALPNESQWQLGSAAASSGDETTEAFLRAATVLVNEQGYRGASVDKISARLNVTKGSFYHHHDNKHDLITACFDRSFVLMHRALDLGASTTNQTADGWSSACAAARVLVRHQLSPEGPLLRTTATSALPDEAHRARVRLTMNRLTQRMHDVLVDGMIDGSVRPLDPAVAAQCVIAAINAAAELHRWVPSAQIDNAAELYVRPLFEGLLVAGSA